MITPLFGLEQKTRAKFKAAAGSEQRSLGAWEGGGLRFTRLGTITDHKSHPKPLGKMSFLSLQKWWDMLVLYYRVALVSLGATIGS